MPALASDWAFPGEPKHCGWKVEVTWNGQSSLAGKKTEVTQDWPDLETWRRLENSPVKPAREGRLLSDRSANLPPLSRKETLGMSAALRTVCCPQKCQDHLLIEQVTKCLFPVIKQ